MNGASHDASAPAAGFNTSAAVTRSLLGYGVIAGPIYVVVGLAQALTRDGFDLSRHSLSLLANGPWGWVQSANLIVTGLMAVAAGIGLSRATRPARRPGWLVAAFGGCVALSGVFAADPADGFPPGTPDGVPESASLSGVVHLAAGGIGFLTLGIAYLLLGRWFASRSNSPMARSSRIFGVIVLAAFFGGAALATTSAGILLLWTAVLAGWAWLAIASVAVYRTVPHPTAA